MNKQDRTARLLASGMKASTVAALVGCSASYISQLIADPDFKEYVGHLIQQTALEVVEEDEERKSYADKLAGAEHTLLDKIIERAPLMEDRLLAQALHIVGNRRDAMEAQKLKLLPHAQQGETKVYVEITIPAQCAPELTISNTGEIISIGSRSTTPMPTAQLRDLLDAESRGITYDQTNHQSATS